MPLPAAILPTIISGGAALVGQGINALSQARANRQQLKYNQQTYAQQRKDSLSDFDMQNRYNSPQQQMQRLKEAGLNPAMIYGKGTVDNFGGSIKSADAKNYSPIAPKLDMSVIGENISRYADVELKKAQTDNLRSAIETSVEDRALKKAQALKIAKDTDIQTFELMKRQLFLDTDLDAKREGVRKTRFEISKLWGSEERAWEVHDAMLKPNLNEKLARIAEIKARTSNSPFQQSVLKAQAQKINQDNHIFGTTGRQQIELNNLLQQEKYQSMILTGEKIVTEQFKRALEDAKFTQSQINSVLQLILPNKPTNKNVNINRNY
jgi:hypothetical protein